MFNQRGRLVFKRLRIVRSLDKRRNTLVYLTCADRLIDGSPQNPVMAVAVAVDRVTDIPVKP